MARAVPGSELIASRRSRVCFELATERDDAEVRRLLRDNPMQSQIALSLEREPSFFADSDLPGEAKQTIVARENGRVVCMGSCTTRLRFVGGEQLRVGYLGGLRLDGTVAGRFDIVRGGYEFFHELQRENPADIYFTSIAADNERARRFLERGLPGMPRYNFVGEFVTGLLPVLRRRAKAVQQCESATSDEILAFQNRQNRQYQFAPCWSAEELTALQVLGLKARDFHIVRKDGQIRACAALWDQRSFKQAVVRGYSGRLSCLRPFINVGARVAGHPSLPAPGTTLANAFVSHLAATDDAETFLELLSTLSIEARRRNIELLTVGFAAHDPRFATMRAHFPCREYRSRIYQVHWPEMNGAALYLSGGCLAPEAALL